MTESERTQKPGKRVSKVTIERGMEEHEANIWGNVHGGVIMRLIDTAGGYCTIEHSERPTVTVSVDSLEFMEPVYVEDTVSVQARITYVGKTSMETEIDVVAENLKNGDGPRHTNKAYLVYVALDKNKKPVEVPSLILKTEEERRKFEEGKQRQTERLTKRKKN